MEAYAVFDSAEESPLPRPSAFSLKCVSDFADSRNDDRFQRYAACHTAAECLRSFVEAIAVVASTHAM
jgi:nucleoside phosphorylase